MHQSNPSVAITGIGLRVPHADSREEFWRLLCSGTTAIERALGGPDQSMVNAGGWLTDIDRFDAGRFGLSRAEAEMMDPQHRVFLECCVEALDDAGLDPFRTASNIAVFAGCSSSSYLLNQLARPLAYRSRPDELQPLLGNDKDYLCTRVSYLLNLRGPSMNVQTACSTSLVAVHLACQSLLLHECDAALVGGVTIRVPQDMGYRAQEGGYLSPSGECRPFDSQASGAVFGNGAGCVLLKRNADAVRDGCRIYARINGSAVNNDGGVKAGFTAPSLEGQARSLAEAYAVANVDPARISLIEAHGTGTALGDPIEMAALRRVIDPPGRRTSPCLVSSVKGTTGHLESAAGITGLIKAALCLWHELIPPQAGFSESGPLLDTGRWISIPTSAQPWGGAERYAGVSSFGIGGTNAHVVLSAAEKPVSASQLSGQEGERDELLVVAGRDQADLEDQCQAMADWLDASGHGSLGSLAYAMGSRRSAAPVRRAVVGRSKAEWREQLKQPRGRSPESASPGWVWVYSGQGGSEAGELSRRWEEMQAERWFREETEAWEKEVERRTGWGIGPSLQGREEGASLWQKQLVRLVWQMGLTAQLRGWGLEAAAVVGHSAGEVAAAVAAGAMGRGEGVEVVWRRGLQLEKLQGQGGMIAVRQESMPEAPEGLSLAALNGPSWKVWSGENGPLRYWHEQWERQGLEVRRIETMGVPGHGPAVEQGARALERELAGEKWNPSLRIRMRSSVTGGWLKAVDAQYWRRNLRETVRFDQAIAGLLEEGFRHFVEVGTQAVLGGAIEEQMEASSRTGEVEWSLRRGEPARRSLLRVAGRAFESGQALRWNNIASGHQVVDLPPFPWRRERYWFSDAPQIPESAPALAAWPGAHVESSLPPHPHFWQMEIRPDIFWQGHAWRGEAIFPATAFLELVRAAHAELTGIGRELLFEEVTFSGFLSLQKAINIQTCLERADVGFRFTVSSKNPGGGWTEHASGRVSVSSPANQTEKPLADIENGRLIEVGAHYKRVRSWGIEYSGAFCGLAAIRAGEDEAEAEIGVEGGGSLAATQARIAWLDAALQLTQTLKPGAFFPIGIARLHIAQWEPAKAQVRAKTNGSLVVSEGGREMIRIEGLEVKGRREGQHHIHMVRWSLAFGSRASGHKSPAAVSRNHWVTQGNSALAAQLRKKLGGAEGGTPAGQIIAGHIIAGLGSQDADGLFEVLSAARDLLRLNPRAEIWWMTSGSVSVRGELLTDPNGALLRGLGRVFVNEYPGAAIGLVDVNDEADLDAFVCDLRKGTSGRDIVYRNGNLWNPAIERIDLDESSPGHIPPVHPNASYWVTGGRGGLGLASAEWLARYGARFIVLISRGPADLDDQRKLRESGSEIVNLRADVSNFDELRNATECLSGAPPLRGILHAAGHLSDGLIDRLERDQMFKVLAPKLEGTWNLQRLTRDIPLDFFVCYSSIGSLIGPPGQASHAAANSFLDAFAEYRRGLGLPALSVNWGPWADVGYSAERGLNDGLAAKGIYPVSREMALSSLGTLLNLQDCRQAGVFDFDAERWRRSLPGAIQPEGLRKYGLRSVPPGKAGTRMVESVVACQAARVLRMPQEDISVERPLREYGLDSLRSFELRNFLETAFGTRIPATAVWRHNTIRAIAGYCRTLVDSTHTG